ncbi:hypothetical protein [Lacipirellula sp.]|uniref:hypothetical protein n=1 Tax=Lacipirellula sp. TaxID=2691419 RepID=UPI003D1060BC
MNWNDLPNFALLLLAGGVANYIYAEPMARFFHRLVPGHWDSEPECQRTCGRMLSAAGGLLFAVTFVTG